MKLLFLPWLRILFYEYVFVKIVKCPKKSEEQHVCFICTFLKRLPSYFHGKLNIFKTWSQVRYKWFNIKRYKFAQYVSKLSVTVLNICCHFSACNWLSDINNALQHKNRPRAVDLLCNMPGLQLQEPSQSYKRLLARKMQKVQFDFGLSYNAKNGFFL